MATLGASEDQILLAAARPVLGADRVDKKDLLCAGVGVLTASPGPVVIDSRHQLLARLATDAAQPQQCNVHEHQCKLHQTGCSQSSACAGSADLLA